MNNNNYEKRPDSTENIPTGRLVTVKRKKTSISIDRALWDDFIKKCRRQGISTCHVLEAFIYGYNQGAPDHPTTILPAINVNLNVERVVKRARRYAKRDVKTYYVGSLDQCAECPSTTVLYEVGHDEDPFTHVKRYLCPDCFRYARRYGEADHFKKLKTYPGLKPHADVLPPRPPLRGKVRGPVFRVQVKDFEDWIGINIF